MATIDDAGIRQALRDERSMDEVCRAAGVSEREFLAARDAYLRRRLPPLEARLPAAVQGPVEILRDRSGVPHVYARTTPDLYFGVGFAMAQDRLWQMDRLRRRAFGRQAEILGPAYVRSDLAHRTVGVDQIARQEAERLDGPERPIVEAFVAGINRQIEACGAHLPVEFDLLGYAPEPFDVAGVTGILRGLWWSLNGRIEQLVVAEAARLLPDEALRAAFLTPEAPEARIVPGGSYQVGSDALAPLHAPLSSGAGAMGTGDGTGSNNWAVSGRRAASGRALLCGDPHQPFWVPSSWYEYGVHGPEDNAAGASHPGVPGLWWGSNGDAAWAITNNAASTRDLYVEEVDAHDPSRYRDGATWRTFETRPVEVAVRGGAAQRFVVRSTVRGPVMNDVLPSVDEGGDPPLTLRWVGQEHLDDLRALIALGRSRDWPAFRQALRDWAVPVFNFVFAGRGGFVGYQCAGRVPVRGRLARGYRQANHPQDTWQGYLPFDALPRLEDPPRGYVASANQRAVPDDYPYPLHGAWAAGYRATRLEQALAPAAGGPLDGSDEGTGSPTTFGPPTSDLGPGLDRAQMVALQNDVKSTRAERLCPPLVRILGEGGHAAGPDVRLVCETLAGWDRRYTEDGAAPAVFEALMQAWQERVAAERFPARLVALVKGQGGPAARVIEREAPGWFAGDGAAAAALAEAARQAIAGLRRRYGDDPAGWRWGAIHQAYWRHPLNLGGGAPEAAGAVLDVGPAPVDGGGDTVRNTGCDADFQASSGAEYRVVVNFAQPDRFWAVQNVGNSGQPGSPHYQDQFPDWLAGRYHVVHLRREGVEADLEGRTLLAPRPS